MPPSLASQLRLLANRANLQLFAILLQHALIMIYCAISIIILPLLCSALTFPKLLRGILARDPLKNLRSTGMLIHKVRDVVYVLVDHNVHALLGRGVRLYFLGGDCFRHCEFWRRGEMRERLCGDGPDARVSS
jgi:hypothetical protein